MFLKIILLFVVALGIGGLSSYLYEKFYQPKVSYEDYENMFGLITPVDPVFSELITVCDRFNCDDVRYLVVDSLPAVEDVVDRRALYILLLYTCDTLYKFEIYTCAAGVWEQVDLNSDIGEFLGRV